VPDEPALLRLKAEACRRLADLSEDSERKTLWLKRADDWEKLAIEATTQRRRKHGRRPNNSKLTDDYS
jgi:hypothetical protein